MRRLRTASPAGSAGLGILGRAVVGALIACGASLIVVPLLVTLYVSVFREQIVIFPPRSDTLDWYRQILPQFGGALRTSFVLALAATALSLLVGVPAGVGLSRYRFAGRRAVGLLLLAPLTVPAIAIGLGIYVCAVMVEDITGVAITGAIGLLIMAHLMITVPWVVRLCVASLVNLDPAAEEAAASLGARPLRVLWRVTLPGMREGILAAALFAFIISFESLEMTMFLIAPGMTTLPIAMLQYLEYHVDPLVAAAAVAQMAVVGLVLLVLERLVRPATVLR